MPKDAVIVVGNADNPTAGEADLQHTLERDLLFSLVTFADDSELARDFDPGLVIISSSVNASTLNDEWADEPAPIVVMDNEVWPYMGGTGEYGTLSLRDFNGIEVVQPDHPILKTFPDPCDLHLVKDDLSLSFVIPDNPEAAILRVKGGRGQALIFEYEMGDKLSNVDGEDPRIARHRRLSFFVEEGDIVELNRDVKLLLMNTLLYAWSGSIDRF